MKKLSIIIPVYNVEKYVGRCIESCLDQDLPKDQYEVLVVNDGTKDNSVAVVEKYITPENNVTLIHRENGGLSAARNTGLQHAQGEYVWFVDSDDWITESALTAIFDELRNDIDILQIQHRLVYDNHSYDKDVIDEYEYGIKDGPYITKNGKVTIPVPFAIYRREFLIENNLKFVEGILHEDMEFKPRAVYLAKKISSTKHICYNYYKGNINSITSNHTIRNVEGSMYAAESLVKFCKNVDGNCRAPIFKLASVSINSAIFSYIHLEKQLDADIAKQCILKNKSTLHCMLKTNSLRYFLEGVFLLVSPNLFFKLYKKLKKL